jgi:putative spermidine/putrescine transport system ATP-binding protein
MTNALEVTGALKKYGPVTALGGVSLRVEQGEFLTLLGPSGCGKSTLLGLIAGSLEPDAGEIYIAGRRVDTLPSEKRNIGMVFQSYALFPHLRVRENVAFGLRMRRVAEPEIKRRVAEALELVGLSAMLERYPRQLSGGQQQRVALARALVIEPALLLLDEPLSNLDARLREQLRDELRGLQRRLRTSSVYVTHDQAEALALSDRIAVMNAGKIIEIGSSLELYRTPKFRFTAEFLGHTNLVRAQAEHGVLTLSSGERLPWDGASVNQARGEVMLSIRPEDIGLEIDLNGQAVIETVLFLGAWIEYLVRLGGDALRVQVPGGGSSLLHPGDCVTLRWPNQLHSVLEQDPESQIPTGQDSTGQNRTSQTGVMA